jgi:hypothetical protein
MPNLEQQWNKLLPRLLSINLPFEKTQALFEARNRYTNITRHAIGRFLSYIPFTRAYNAKKTYIHRLEMMEKEITLHESSKLVNKELHKISKAQHAANLSFSYAFRGYLDRRIKKNNTPVIISTKENNNFNPTVAL